MARRRALIESAASHAGLPDSRFVAVTPKRMTGGVACIECSVPAPVRQILYLHGGGYRVGSPEMWVSFAARLASATTSLVLVPDYRLAPEHPFPAGLHDACAVYESMLRVALPVVVAGDSAGGGLAAAVSHACRRSAVEQPAVLALISPWVDLTNSASTFASRSMTDEMFSKVAAAEAAELYLQGEDPRNPLISPIFGDLIGFPPTVLFAGGSEVLLGDAIAFAAKLADAGTTTEAHFVAGMQHVWLTVQPELEQSVDALDALTRFCSRHSTEAKVERGTARGGRED